MKSGKLFIVFFLATSFYATAQNRNSIWCFGDSAGINFSNINNPVPITTSMLLKAEVHVLALLMVQR
jgi:hypothetical protein